VSDREDQNDKDFGRIDRLLLDSRCVVISREVSDRLADRVIKHLLVLETRDAKAPITVYVNSPGGSADSGFAIYDMLRFVSPPVRTVCSGLCASAAVIIYLGAPKGSRYSLPNSRFLIHQPSTVAMGSASDIEITANEILAIKRRYNEIVAAETGKPVAQIDKDADRDFWLSAQAAQEYGLVDQIVETRAQLG
jgi:ATP-dependent Clp protease protease subunit